MQDKLSIDEFDALEQVSKLKAKAKPSACVARNTKRLAGLKFISFGKDGSLTLTDKGKETLHIKHCIEGLRAVAADPLTSLRPEVAAFLSRKGHIAPMAEGGFEVTARGRESLADIDGQ